MDAADLRAITRGAFIYGFPLYEMYRVRWGAVYSGRNPARVGLNAFVHARELADPTRRGVTAPNNDTMYSSAWLDLAAEPIVMHVPDTAGRYYSLQFMDFYTNTFKDIGRRTTGTKAGDFLVAGPEWKGAAPDGLAVIRSPTNAVWLLGRTLVDGPDDVSNVRALQQQFTLTSLSAWQHKPPMIVPASAPPPLDTADPWDFFKVVDRALTENPPPERDAGLMRSFRRIGVGPGIVFSPELLAPAQRDIVLRALGDAREELRNRAAREAPGRNGWVYPPANLGNYGTDFELRALVALVGLAALDPAEAMYFGTRHDDAGRPLNGTHRYLLHFPKGTLPDVGAFWSLTMYQIEADQRVFLVANPIARYSIGDRTRGVRYKADGSLDILLQHEAPDADQRANWLPAPAGDFRVSLRAYQPGPDLLAGRYEIPGIKRID